MLYFGALIWYHRMFWLDVFFFVSNRNGKLGKCEEFTCWRMMNRSIQLVSLSRFFYITLTLNGFSDVNKVFSIAPRWMNLENARHFLRLSMAGYGWPFVMYLHCGTGLFRILNNVTCCSCFGNPQYTMVVDDNCCSCHLAGVKHISKINEEDILFASFRNHVFEVSFFIIQSIYSYYNYSSLIKCKIVSPNLTLDHVHYNKFN